MEKEVQKPYMRHNHVHGAKRQLVGNQARQVPPAWRTNNIATGQTTAASTKGKEVQGSKIFISGLPTDVREKEIEELFKKTVGPLKEVFIVYNSHSTSKGMAVVTFQLPGDAVLARNKYHGKIVDGRRPIKIEIMLDGVPRPSAQSAPNPSNSLFSRIADAPSHVAPIANGIVHSGTISAPAPLPQRVGPATVKPAALPPRRIRRRKGPKRLKKRTTVEELDQEMDDYRAAALDDGDMS